MIVTSFLIRTVLEDGKIVDKETDGFEYKNWEGTNYYATADTPALRFVIKSEGSKHEQSQRWIMFKNIKNEHYYVHLNLTGFTVITGDCTSFEETDVFESLDWEGRIVNIQR